MAFKDLKVGDVFYHSPNINKDSYVEEFDMDDIQNMLIESDIEINPKTIKNIVVKNGALKLIDTEGLEWLIPKKYAACDMFPDDYDFYFTSEEIAVDIIKEMIEAYQEKVEELATFLNEEKERVKEIKIKINS